MAKKKKIEQVEFEFPIKCSARLLYQMISTSTGLAEWFAEKVETRGDIFVFHWGDEEESAELIELEDNEAVRFEWTDNSHVGDYFEMSIKVDELTNDVALVIVDFCEPGEKDETFLLWETQVSELMHAIGAA
ncbi:MAG: SRPBCC domain-containing protein [Bacteroidia bacterium]|nr:SRPBCC domain-containing protein [Bacteroidia bacterium]